MNSKNPIGIAITAAAVFLLAGAATATEHATTGVTAANLANVSRLVETLGARVDALEKQNRSLESELQSLRDRDRALQDFDKKMGQRIDAIKQPDLAPIEARIEAIRAGVEKQERAVAAANEKNAAQDSAIALTNTLTASLKSADTSLEKRLETLDVPDIKPLQSEIAALKIGQAAQENAISKLQSSQAAYASGLADLQSVDQSLRDQSASLAQRVDALKLPDVTPILSEVAAIKAVNDSQAESIGKLVSKEEALMVAATGLQAQIDGIPLPDLTPVEDMLSALATRQNTVESAITSLKSEISENQASASELKKNGNALMVAATGLQAQIDALEVPDISAVESDIAALQTAFDQLGEADERMRAKIENLVDLDLPQLSADVDGLKRRLSGVTRSGDTLRFDAMNVQLTSGSGASDGEVNGLGNLIIGYDEAITPFLDGEKPVSEKSGSHNLIIGKGHNYEGYGGIAAGLDNVIAGNYGLVAGTRNQALGDFSTVTGGQLNTASGWYASVSGGFRNLASENSASIAGGQLNIAAGAAASISGGYQVHASGNSNWAAGRLFQRQ